jgi:hypothetical protein
LILITASDELLAAYVQNIVNAYIAAAKEQKERGRLWYRTAHDLASVVGQGDVRRGAGLIAALSPMKQWKVNVKLARDASGGNIHGHTGVTLAKVRQIMGGVDPEDVLPDESKTWNFFRAILDPDDPDVVVIDRHAHDVAVGIPRGGPDNGRGLGSKQRYAIFALAYRLATRELVKRGFKVIPNTVQATTWIWQQERENVSPGD